MEGTLFGTGVTFVCRGGRSGCTDTVVFLSAQPMRVCHRCRWLRCGGCAFGRGAVLDGGLTEGTW